MNVWLKLFAFGVIVGVVTCGGYSGRVRLPKPVPPPKPIPSTCLPKPLCGGFANAQCPSGYTCRYRPGTDIGDCCPVHPKPVPLPKPLPIPLPKPLPSNCLINTPPCGGFANAQCPLGYTCRYRPNADFGDCCSAHPKPVPLPKPVPSTCLTKTICGGIANAKCGLGYTCRYRPGTDFGNCCPVKQDPCFGLGQDGICGGIAGLQCRPGTKCTSIGLDGIPDGHGVCCITRPIIKPPVLGKCPRPSGLAAKCVFPRNKCLRDSDCGRFRRCCPDSCGKVCQRMFPRRG